MLNKLTKKIAATMIFICLLAVAVFAQKSETRQPARFQMPVIIQPKFSKKTFDVRRYGAKSDGTTDSTGAIGKAIEAARRAGGGTVIFPEGIWLTGPIVLVSNVRLHLEKNAVISFSKNRNDYPLVATTFEGVAAYRAQAPISAVKVRNTGITGEGVIDGGGDAWRPVKRGKLHEAAWKTLVASGGKVTADGNTWYPSESALKGSTPAGAGEKRTTKNEFEAIRDFLRPNMVQISESKNILMEGVTFQNSPAWTLHFILSEHITLRGVKVRNPWYGQNNDAVDLESSRNALLEDCVFDTGDDAVTLKSGRDEEGRRRGVPTENIVARNITVYHAHGGFVIGSEMSGGVRNVSITNSTFIGTDVGLRFKTQRGRGGLVEKVYADNISMKEITGDAILFDMYYGGKDRDPEKIVVTEATPRFQDFFLSNIVVQGAKRGIFIRGLPEMSVKNVRMQNLIIQADTGMYSEEAEGIAIKNLTLLTKDSAPLIDVRASRGLTFDNLNYKPGTALLVSIAGKTSRDIKVINTDTSNAKKDFQYAAEVPIGILKQP